MRKALALLPLFFMAACGTPPPSGGVDPDVATASQAWARAFNTCNAEGAAALYQPDAMLWGTVSSTITSGRAGVQKYFERVCSSPQPPQVSFGEQHVRTYGDTAINSGTYTFTVMVQGQPRPFPARYSFTYRKASGQWLIADHHSSALPAPPAPAASAPGR